MTNEERAALVKWLVEEAIFSSTQGDANTYTELVNVIKADGLRIEELEALTQKLMGYADHDRDCEDMTGAYPGSCTCGYSAVARAALGETQ